MGKAGQNVCQDEVLSILGLTNVYMEGKMGCLPGHNFYHVLM